MHSLVVIYVIHGLEFYFLSKPLKNKDMILGPEGPLEVDANINVLLFESALFDLSKMQRVPPSVTTRIALENRAHAVQTPENWLDNLTGSLDALELELKSVQEKSVICLHSNQLLLDGSKEIVLRFKSLVKQHLVVLSISVPPSIVDESQGAEYLISHIHYGSSNGSFLFGLLGPLLVDEFTTLSNAKMYTIAQNKAGNVLLLVHVRSVEKLKSLVLDSPDLFDFGRTVFFGICSTQGVTELLEIGAPHVNLGLEINPDSDSRQEATFLSPHQAIDVLNTFKNDRRITPVISTGAKYKTDLIKYGGQGIGFSLNFLRRLYPNYLNSSNQAGLSLLDFSWNPPKLNVKKEEDIPKWVCDICGQVGRSDEQQNYTKHGFTYCSIACLSEHRKRNFK